MEKKTIVVSVEDVDIGMFVSSLDRPWIDTPFPLQGFTILDEKELNLVKETCKYVYVDENSLPKNFTPKSVNQGNKVCSRTLDEDLPKRNPKRYETMIDFEAEIEKAKEIKQQLSTTVSYIFEEIISGNPLDINQVKKAVGPMVNSVIRNPDAMIWLARLKNKSGYMYKHSMSVAVWSVSLGRQLGLPVEELNELATGALLADIGKTEISSDLLNKPDTLSPEEFETIKSHVKLGANILERSKGTTENINNIVLYHHERFSGNGYPKGLSQTDIPIFARIVAIADCYDAITSQRPFKHALSSSEAITKLYEWRDIDFQKELIEEFIQSIGVYPAGSLIELSDDSVAIVVATGREQRLRPKLMRVLDANKKPFRPLKIIDLMHITEDENGNPLNIARSLPGDAYGIDPDEYYL